eukprot:CAMPEP_0195600164 /NCGR_PEP_ID=MMETSP0815-20121206/4412_1 /TAXON_ID=97485 /ORGANISM="Prymnesium parvum, Strain Texoma1" /LENGTH=137 /DNA_ID=CAMNT_0040739633 /DNA_START=405 /DNA_END=816 /DNA_ORIENTATION=+
MSQAVDRIVLAAALSLMANVSSARWQVAGWQLASGLPGPARAAIFSSSQVALCEQAERPRPIHSLVARIEGRPPRQRSGSSQGPAVLRAAPSGAGRDETPSLAACSPERVDGRATSVAGRPIPLGGLLSRSTAPASR